MSTTPADELTDAPGRGGRRRRHLALVVALTVGVLLLDQATKAWALAQLSEMHRDPVLGSVLGLQLVFNPGAALSIATGMTWVLTLIACGVVIVVVRASRRLGSTGWAVALGLLLGGALGNLVDRLVREPGVGRGHVVDFIAYANLFVGNVADIAIVVAAGLVMIQALRGVRLDGSREQSAPRHEAPGTDG
jgi:signal peptidase II